MSSFDLSSHQGIKVTHKGVYKITERERERAQRLISKEVDSMLPAQIIKFTQIPNQQAKSQPLIQGQWLSHIHEGSVPTLTLPPKIRDLVPPFHFYASMP